MARADDAPGVVFVIDADGGGDDEELAPREARRAASPRQLLAIVAVALALAGLAVRGVLSAHRDTATAPTTKSSVATDAPGAGQIGRQVASFEMEGPDGTYYDVPYLLSSGTAGGRGDGVLPHCASRSVCRVERTLPAVTLAALRTSFPAARVLDSWSVVVIKPAVDGAAPARILQDRVAYVLAANVSITIQIRAIDPTDSVRSTWQAGVSGTRTDYATQVGDRLVQLNVFERYVSTKGVVAPVRALVRGAALMVAG